jgi:hypothetical protein
MKYAEYKLAGDIPASLLPRTETRDGKEVKVPFTIKTREAETLTEMHALVENGDEKHVLRLAQGQYDIIVQRKIREYLASEEVADILAGKTVGEGEDAVDFAAHTDDERIAEVLSRTQTVADEFAYGSRQSLPGGGKTAAVERDKKVRAAAAADPELAAKLAALGITL